MVTFKELGNFGRLGNSMFQVAATVALANRNNDDAKFPIWKYSHFFKKHLNLLGDGELINYNEPYFHYFDIPYQANLNLRGYFQSERYFADCKDLIAQQFEFVDGLLDPKWDNIRKDCSIHVRRTDYLKLQNYHPFPGIEYYNECIEIMKRGGCKNFLVFSDDMAWCRNNFPKDFIFVDGQNEVQDLCLMSRCDNNIIANSSFSWWGAWLNRNKKKVVLAPERWFGPANPASTTDLYCDGWLKVQSPA